jgi:uncharacterized protein YndB with AHSA1/START domain
MTEQTKTRSAEGEVTIDATPERVWQAMTDERSGQQQPAAPRGLRT